MQDMISKLVQENMQLKQRLDGSVASAGAPTPAVGEVRFLASARHMPGMLRCAPFMGCTA